MQWRSSKSAVCFLAAIGVLSMGLGCSDEEPERKYRTLEGTALEVDPPRRVSMSFVNEDGMERTVSGSVSEDAEVWVNGRQAILEDVKAGDFVKVVGYAEGSGTNVQFVATKIEVERTTFEDVSGGDTDTTPDP